VSKLDNQLGHSVYCGVWEAHINAPCTCDLDAARTELAALRRRAEDAEMIVRSIFDADLNADQTFDWYFDGDGKIQFPGRFVLAFDRATRLPILTDEAREALKT